jgi:hypothetical protein
MRPNPGGGGIGDLLLALLGGAGQQFSRSEEQRRQQEAEAQRQKAATDANAAQLQTQITAQREQDRLRMMREQVQKNAESFRNALVLPDVQANPEKQARLLGGFQASMELLNTADPTAFDRGFTDYSKNLSGILNEADQTVFQFKQGQETNKLLTPLLQRVLEDSEGKYDPATRQQAASIVQDIQSGKSADLSRVAGLQANRFDANAFLKLTGDQQAERLVNGGMAQVGDDGSVSYTADGQEFLIRNGLAQRGQDGSLRFNNPMFAPDGTAFRNRQQRDAASTAQTELDTLIKQNTVDYQNLQKTQLGQSIDLASKELSAWDTDKALDRDTRRANLATINTNIRGLEQQIANSAELNPIQRQIAQTQLRTLQAQATVAERTIDTQVRAAELAVANAGLQNDAIGRQITQLDQQIGAFDNREALNTAQGFANLQRTQTEIDSAIFELEQRQDLAAPQKEVLLTQLRALKAEVTTKEGLIDPTIRSAVAEARAKEIELSDLETTAPARQAALRVRYERETALGQGEIRMFEALEPAQQFEAATKFNKLTGGNIALANQIADRFEFDSTQRNALLADASTQRWLASQPKLQEALKELSASVDNPLPAKNEQARSQNRSAVRERLRTALGITQEQASKDPRMRIYMDAYDAGITARDRATTDADRKAAVVIAQEQAQTELIKAQTTAIPANTAIQQRSLGVQEGNLAVQQSNVTLERERNAAQRSQFAAEMAFREKQLGQSKELELMRLGIDPKTGKPIPAGEAKVKTSEWLSGLNSSIDNANSTANAIEAQLRKEFTKPGLAGQPETTDPAMYQDPRYLQAQELRGWAMRGIQTQAAFINGGKPALAITPGTTAAPRATPAQMQAVADKIATDPKVMESVRVFFEMQYEKQNGLWTPDKANTAAQAQAFLAQNGITLPMLDAYASKDYRPVGRSTANPNPPAPSAPAIPPAPSAPAIPQGRATPANVPVNPNLRTAATVAAQGTNLNPSWLVALTKGESAGGTNTYNPTTGAAGFFQIMPAQIPNNAINPTTGRKYTPQQLAGASPQEQGRIYSLYLQGNPAARNARTYEDYAVAHFLPALLTSASGYMGGGYVSNGMVPQTMPNGQPNPLFWQNASGMRVKLGNGQMGITRQSAGAYYRNAALAKGVDPDAAFR